MIKSIQLQFYDLHLISVINRLPISVINSSGTGVVINGEHRQIKHFLQGGRELRRRIGGVDVGADHGFE